MQRVKTIIILLTLVFIVSCNGNSELRNSSLQAKSILDHASKLISPKKAVNKIKDGKIESTVIEYDTSKAKEYLQGKEKEFSKYYWIVKKYVGDKRHCDDALFVLAYLNDTIYYLKGSSVENSCIYITAIKQKEKLSLSSWVYDDFYPSSMTEDFLRDWQRMTDQEKYQAMIQSLFVPEGNVEKCK